eukprot:6084658-Amphidinium_carterae.1
MLNSTQGWSSGLWHPRPRGTMKLGVFCNRNENADSARSCLACKTFSAQLLASYALVDAGNTP